VVVLSIVIQIAGLALPVVTGAIVDRVIPSHDLPLLYTVLVGTALLSVFGFMAFYIRAYILTELRTRFELTTTLDLTDHMLALPLPFFHLRQIGDLMMRLNSNATIREALATKAPGAVLDGILVLSY